jgi:hypothetical protein
MGFSSLRSLLILGSARCINYLQTSKNLSPTCCRYRDSPTCPENAHLRQCRTKLGRGMIGPSESDGLTNGFRISTSHDQCKLFNMHERGISWGTRITSILFFGNKNVFPVSAQFLNLG